MLRQHHEESFASAEPDERLQQNANDLISFVWVTSAHDDLSTALNSYIVTALRLAVPIEFVLVNNGYNEAVLDTAISLIQDKGIPVTTVQLHAHSPDSVALSAACRAAKGNRMVTLPSYLQVAPDGLIEMVALSETDLDFVASVRVARVDGKSEQAKSRWFNRAVRWLSGISLRDLNSGLKVFKREVIEGVPSTATFTFTFRFWLQNKDSELAKLKSNTWRNVTERADLECTAVELSTC